MQFPWAATGSLPFFNISKITPPRLANVLNRPRLINLLEQNQEKKLILIHGQAAQGKSTLAASYVDTRRRPTAWINLGPEESDPVTLFYLMAHALQQVLPEVDLSSRTLFLAVSPSLREEISPYREWSQALFNKIATPVQVILDGLERLAPETGAFRFLQSLLEEMPPHVQLFMLSQEMPPLEIQTLIMQQVALVLTNENLAFNLLETRNFLKTGRGLLLSTETVRRLHELTEGWVGGLMLLCEGLAHIPEKARETYVLDFLLEKLSGEMYDFFGEKIFAANPPQVQEFLIKSSILDTLEPNILSGYAGLGNAREILENLHQRNFFVQASNTREKGLTYRYHQLFREFLQSKFISNVNPEQQAAAYTHLAYLYTQHGALEEAVKYFLLGRDYVQAGAIIARTGLELMKTGRLAELSRWLNFIPDEMLQSNPWLLFYRFITRRLAGTQEATTTLEKALSLFEQQEDIRGVLLALAYLLELSVIGGKTNLPILTLMEKSEQLLQSPGAEQFAYERALLMVQLGYAHFRRTGQCYKGYLICRNASVVARSLNDSALQLHALVYAFVNLTAMGEFSEAVRLDQKIQALLKKYPSPSLQALHFLHVSYHYLWRGDLEQADAWLQQAQELVENHGLYSISLVVLMQRLVLGSVSGNYQEAAVLGQQVLNLTQSMGNFYFYGVILVILAQNYYRTGNYAKAQETIKQATTFLSAPESLGLFQLWLCQGINALISYYCQDLEVNEEKLPDALNYFSNAAMPYFLMSTHLILALVKEQKGKAHEAARHLAQGFQIAREKSYCHHVELTNQDLARACGLALELEVAEAVEYAAQLLTTRLAAVAEPELAWLSRLSNRKVAKKALELERIRRQSLAPRIQIQTLGEFQVRRNGCPIPDEDWEGHQPHLLLKAVVCRSSSRVPKDVLIEDLWPRSPSGYRRKQFQGQPAPVAQGPGTRPG